MSLESHLTSDEPHSDYGVLVPPVTTIVASLIAAIYYKLAFYALWLSIKEMIEAMILNMAVKDDEIETKGNNFWCFSCFPVAAIECCVDFSFGNDRDREVIM